MPAYAGADPVLGARFQPLEQPAGVVALRVLGFGTPQARGELVSRSNSLVPTGGRELGRRSAAAAGLVPAGTEEVLLRLPDGRERMLWSWYLVDGRAVGGALEARLREASTALRGKPLASALVVVSTPLEDALAADPARARLAAFLERHGDRIAPCLREPSGTACEELLEPVGEAGPRRLRDPAARRCRCRRRAKRCTSVTCSSGWGSVVSRTAW
jgi:EpsI family protein